MKVAPMPADLRALLSPSMRRAVARGEVGALVKALADRQALTPELGLLAMQAMRAKGYGPAERCAARLWKVLSAL